MAKKKIILILSISFLYLNGFTQSVVSDQSGFFKIDPVNYYFHNGSSLSRIYHTTSTGLFWYTFLKADSEPEKKPIFVFFNGGPGSSTTCGLMGFYTGRKTLDNNIMGGGEKYIDNPYSWTKMGNVLYIDARCTGFSYGIFDGERTRENISIEFIGKNFNSYIDAADYLRVLLGFLKNNYQIRKNPIIIVGESYGGVRATLMLNMVLKYSGYGDGTEIFQDSDLVARIQEHFDFVFPEYAGQILPPDIIKRQFGEQILIQPAIDNYTREIKGDLLEQKDSVVYEIAEETDTIFTPCSSSNCSKVTNVYDFIENIAGRDIYGCHKPLGWTDSFFSNGSILLKNINNLSEITGIDPRNISEMYASERLMAYKYAFYGPANSELRKYLFDALPEPEKFIIRSKQKRNFFYQRSDQNYSLESVFGILHFLDTYHLALNRDSFYSYFYFNPSIIRGFPSYSYDYLTGKKFLENLIYIKTFITNAKYDLVVYTNALPISLNFHTDIVASSIHEKAKPLSEERPGLITVNYLDGAFGLSENIGTRTIRFPFYTNSSHPVSLTEPEEFYNDVSEWLKENNSGVNNEKK